MEFPASSAKRRRESSSPEEVARDQEDLGHTNVVESVSGVEQIVVGSESEREEARQGTDMDKILTGSSKSTRTLQPLEIVRKVSLKCGREKERPANLNVSPTSIHFSDFRSVSIK